MQHRHGRGGRVRPCRWLLRAGCGTDERALAGADRGASFAATRSAQGRSRFRGRAGTASRMMLERSEAWGSITFGYAETPRAVTSGVASLRCWSSRLDGESKLSEHLDRAGLPALEIAGGKALPRGELISRAQDRFRRITASIPDQVIRRGGSESMRREEPVRA